MGLMRLQKKGQRDLNNSLTYLLSGIVIIYAVVELAPEIFSQLTELEDNADVPTWIAGLMFVVVGISLVMYVVKTFNFGNKK